MQTFDLVETIFSKNGEETTLHGFVDVEKEWKLIADITVTEDSSLNIVTDMNGNDLSLKSFYVNVTADASTPILSTDVFAYHTKNGYGSGNYAGRAFIAGSSGTYNKYAKAVFMRMDSAVFAIGTVTNGSGNAMQSTIMNDSINFLNDGKTIKTIYISSVKKGETIKIYGVRA